MLVLALDTSTPAVTAGVVALADGIEQLAVRVKVDARAHGEMLTPHLTEAVEQAGASLREIDAIVCGAGPGPFTGLRAGMVTAAALAHALDIPAYPVCGLDAIAGEAFQDGAAGPLLVVTDARRREVYWARYDVLGARETGPQVSAPADVDPGDVTTAAGHGAQLYADVLGLPVIEPLYPTPRGLVRVAAAALAAGDEPEPLTPLYLRRPDAKEPGERKRALT